MCFFNVCGRNIVKKISVDACLLVCLSCITNLVYSQKNGMYGRDGDNQSVLSG